MDPRGFAAMLALAQQQAGIIQELTSSDLNIKHGQNYR